MALISRDMLFQFQTDQPHGFDMTYKGSSKFELAYHKASAIYYN